MISILGGDFHLFRINFHFLFISLNQINSFAVKQPYVLFFTGYTYDLAVREYGGGISLTFSTINGHRSILNQLLLLRNQTDIVNDQFITRTMNAIHKLRPSSAKYQEIWDKTLVLCKMFGLTRSSDLVKWSFNWFFITLDSIKGPVINAKEQRKGVLSILELTSLDDTNSQVCPVRHLVTYYRASKGRRKSHSDNSVFIQNEVDTFYDKRIIGEKSGGFLNTVVQIS
ncbi:hypothetical protein ACTFIW_003839 [Dictyostelium discoideum]